MNERIFYFDWQADLSDFTDGIAHTKADTVIFVLPRKSLIFESIVNLQILRSTAEEKNKNMVCISLDAKGRKMCDVAGIAAFASLEEYEGKSHDAPIPAQKNTLEEKLPPLPKKIIPVSSDTAAVEEYEGKSAKISWKEYLLKPSWQALFLLLIFSGGLFFFFSFLAFPGATIYIKPERKILETITNITILEQGDYEKTAPINRYGTIPGFPIENIFEKELNFPTLTKIFEGTNATGQITIINTYFEEKRLRPSTRFQTEEGLIFRISDWALVPSATRDAEGNMIPGKREISVVADEQDIYGEFIGERGNIAPTRFFLPGLNVTMQNKLWAESDNAFSGGESAWNPLVTEEDIRIAQEKIQSELFESAVEDLQNFIAAKNAQEKTDLVFFSGDEFLEKEVLNITVEDNILNTARQSFFVSAQIKIRTWAVSQSDLYDVLEDALRSGVHNKMHLTQVNTENIFPEILDKNEAAGFIKVTITVRGLQEFMIEANNAAGMNFVNTVKTQVAGIPVSEAEALLANREEVSAVSISVWPFWSQKIPRLPENIVVKLDAHE